LQQPQLFLHWPDQPPYCKHPSSPSTAVALREQGQTLNPTFLGAIATIFIRIINYAVDPSIYHQFLSTCHISFLSFAALLYFISLRKVFFSFHLHLSDA
jgi:hypothetical protein